MYGPVLCMKSPMGWEKIAPSQRGSPPEPQPSSPRVQLAAAANEAISPTHSGPVQPLVTQLSQAANQNPCKRFALARPARSSASGLAPTKPSMVLSDQSASPKPLSPQSERSMSPSRITAPGPESQPAPRRKRETAGEDVIRRSSSRSARFTRRKFRSSVVVMPGRIDVEDRPKRWAAREVSCSCLYLRSIVASASGGTRSSMNSQGKGCGTPAAPVA
mmetsp:Transcript_143267/g.445323  ORF Transcript_143267/g.445323 Transcript_143267/m.445323 type:complete len:218 (-) Transcript_143267:629-1282(-)